MAEDKKSVGVDVPEKAAPLEPAEPVQMPAAMGATFAERAAARQKAVQQAENKSVKSSETKSRRK